MLVRKIIVWFGSSPLTRGTQILIVLVMVLARFIPAYAGNSRKSLIERFLESVHPRLRGELGRPHYHAIVFNGSSPLTRGTHNRTLRHPQQYRFIPAYAGNSEPSKPASVSRSVHPRLRGELFSLFLSKKFTTGSSPLTRGTPPVSSLK